MKPIAFLTLYAGLSALALFALAPHASAEDAAGKWSGAVKTPMGDIPVVITILKDAAGKFSAGLESPTQAPGQVLPADACASDGVKLTISATIIMGSYAATWDADKKVWVGKWTQGGEDASLDLSRSN
jgi:uncharacterized protein